jgi:hypothetical protein
MRSINMSKDINYTPGHSVHFIQARKALEALGQWRRVTIINVGEGVVTLQIGDGGENYICGDTTRLREVLGTSRVPLNQQGEYFAIIAPHNVLIIPCADEGKVFPAAAGINSTVSYLDEGAALWSPTTDGAWHLFSVALSAQP